ncbi:hypothetical protein JFT44_22350 [Pseudomonas sp. MF5691]|uniref:structural cement protein Gp24 n=1 Tax=Pseudomonas sp. MF5691 TaxID=2797526 RepID=UPI0018E72DB5|nr:hypothetical protein [Pseudomonas sp. MF5691]MBJ2292662.1 hypothetical protein [Pseudomonas sp. MF5691]
MATYQTTYTNAPAKGVPGLVANEEKCNKISRTVSNAEGIVFGAPGFRVTGAGNDHKIAATGTLFLGLAVLSAAVPPVATGSTLIDGYPRDFTGAFMTDGQMYVTAGAAVVPGDDVYYVAATNRYVTTAAEGAVLIPGAIFDTTGANGDIVEISLKHRSA